MSAKKQKAVVGSQARGGAIETAIRKARADYAQTVVNFDHDRLARVESEILRLRRGVDETAARVGLPREAADNWFTVSNAFGQIEKAKRELARGNFVGATWHLDRAENIFHMRHMNPFSATRIIHAAEQGQKFTAGRKRGAGGPIRKAIMKLLKQRLMKNRELWDALASHPPRGWEFCDNRQGKYIEGPRAEDGMKYGRFCNIAREERVKIMA